MVRQPGGELVVGGEFTVIGGLSRNRIARLNDDGSVDLSFNSVAYANNTVEVIAVQADGKLLLGGTFTEVNGRARARLARLDENGMFDGSFNIGSGFNGAVRALGLAELW